MEYEVHVNRIHLDHVSKFKYFGSVLDESRKDREECNEKEASGRTVAGAVKSLVNARDLQLEWARVLCKTLLVHVLMYGSEAMLRKEKE